MLVYGPFEEIFMLRDYLLDLEPEGLYFLENTILQG